MVQPFQVTGRIEATGECICPICGDIHSREGKIVVDRIVFANSAKEAFDIAKDDIHGEEDYYHLEWDESEAVPLPEDQRMRMAGRPELFGEPLKGSDQ